MKKGPRPPGRAREAADPEGFAERALGFTTVLTDASSLIVLFDVGVLQAAGRAWRLATIASAAAEAGPASEGVCVIEPGPDEEMRQLPTDRALVHAARKERLPLLSEDRKVLMAAEARGLDCFDVLVALELLAATGALPAREYADARARLVERNQYKGDRLSWAEAVGAAAAKLA